MPEHATLVTFSGKGVLLRGMSGCGKSDLAFRLIENCKAKLVADDVVDIYAENNVVFGKVCNNLEGLLEVRGIGIAKYDYEPATAICLVVDLVKDENSVERLPVAEYTELAGIKVPCIKLVGFYGSAEQKILLKLRDNLLKTD